MSKSRSIAVAVGAVAIAAGAVIVVGCVLCGLPWWWGLPILGLCCEAEWVRERLEKRP